MKALIAGGTGVVGQQVINALVSDNDTKAIHGLSRRDMDDPREKVTFHKVDFDNLKSSSAGIPSIDKGFCTLGTTMKKAGSKAAFRKVDYDYVLAFIELCIDKGATHVAIVTAMGASSNSMFFYNQVKGDVERDAQVLCEKHNVHLSIIRPSLIMEENRGEQRIGEKIGIVLMRIIQPLLFGPMKKYRGVTPKQIAKTLITASKKGGSSILESDEILKSD